MVTGLSSGTYTFGGKKVTVRETPRSQAKYPVPTRLSKSQGGGAITYTKKGEPIKTYDEKGNLVESQEYVGTAGGRFVGGYTQTRTTDLSTGPQYSGGGTPQRAPQEYASSPINYSSMYGYSTREGAVMVYDQKTTPQKKDNSIPTFAQQRSEDIRFAREQLAAQKEKERAYIQAVKANDTKKIINSSTDVTFAALKTGFAYSFRPVVTQTGRLLEKDATRRYKENIDNSNFSQSLRLNVANLGRSLREEPGKNVTEFTASYLIGAGVGKVAGYGLKTTTKALATRYGATTAIKTSKNIAIVTGGSLAAIGAADLALTEKGGVAKKLPSYVAGGKGFAQGYRSIIPARTPVIRFSGKEKLFVKDNYQGKYTAKGNLFVTSAPFGLEQTQKVPFSISSRIYPQSRAAPQFVKLRTTSTYGANTLLGLRYSRKTESGVFDVAKNIIRYQSGNEATGSLFVKESKVPRYTSFTTTKRIQGKNVLSSFSRGAGTIRQQEIFTGRFIGTQIKTPRGSQNINMKTVITGKRAQLGISRPKIENTVFSPSETRARGFSRNIPIPRPILGTFSRTRTFYGAISPLNEQIKVPEASRPMEGYRYLYRNASFPSENPGELTKPLTTTNTISTPIDLAATITDFGSYRGSSTRVQPKPSEEPPKITIPDFLVPGGFPVIPPFGFKGKGRSEGYRARREYQYAPSITSILFNVRGKKPQKTVTGFEIRPVTRGGRWF